VYVIESQQSVPHRQASERMDQEAEFGPSHPIRAETETLNFVEKKFSLRANFYGNALDKTGQRKMSDWAVSWFVIVLL
jgi:hypothetical protein